MVQVDEIEHCNNMSEDLSSLFKEYIASAEKTSIKKLQIKQPCINSDKISLDFKIQSIKLLESIFNLKALLDELHREYISLTPQSEESLERCFQAENNSNDMMKLCKECLKCLNSTKFINSSLSKEILKHREAVIQTLCVHLKNCEEVCKENLHVKRMRKPPRKTYRAPIDDDSINDFGGTVIYTESDFSAHDFETMQINTDGVFRRLNAELAEKEQIEKQIYEIGRMNQTLAENVLEQHGLIEHLELASVNSNLDVEFGNDQMKRAMQNQSNMRFWVIFILLVLALSLMFIDWYRT